MEGMGGPWWPEAVETNRFPTDALFCLTKKFIIIKEVLLGCREKFVADGSLKKASYFKLNMFRF